MVGAREVAGDESCAACASPAPAASASTGTLRKKRVGGEVITYSPKNTDVAVPVRWLRSQPNLFFHQLSTFDLLCAMLRKRKVRS